MCVGADAGLTHLRAMFRTTVDPCWRHQTRMMTRRDRAWEGQPRIGTMGQCSVGANNHDIPSESPLRRIPLMMGVCRFRRVGRLVLPLQADWLTRKRLPGLVTGCDNASRMT